MLYYPWKKIGLKGLVIIFIMSSLSNLVLAGTPGTEKWSFKTGIAIWSSPAIGPDGTIYVGSGSLYAINPNGTEKEIYREIYRDRQIMLCGSSWANNPVAWMARFSPALPTPSCMGVRTEWTMPGLGNLGTGK